LEIVLNGQIKEPQNKIKEKESYRASLEFKLRFRIRELEELQETGVLKKRNPPFVDRGSITRGGSEKETPSQTRWKL
jgi:hypothetical protein